MKERKVIQVLAFVLTLCLTLGALPLYVFGDGTETELPEQITETTNENLTAFQLGIGEKSVAELENMTLSAADIPASISRETVEAKDHVLRLREQEADLNTVIFQNRDGGKTVYLFGSPVKYVDANGNVRDKSTTLVSENVTVNGKTYAHSATDNFFGQYYPTMPQNGVMLAFGQYTVEMKPVITGVLTLRDTVVSDNKVTYNKVFGTGTSLVYTPTLNGVKEDIILSAYTGKSSFSFTLKTNGLAIIQDENDTFLADFEGNKVASLGDVIITDSANHTAYGTMTVVTKTEREEYTVTVNAPTAFLTSTTTVYPVTVDPTLSIYDNNTFMDDYGNNLDIIHDMCVYQNGSASAPISTIGSFFYNEDSCEWEESARMLYRLNPYYFSSSDSPLRYMASPRFESASLFTTVSLGQESSVTVDIYPYNAMWSYEENVYGDPIYSNGTTADYTSNPDYNNLIGSVCASTTVYYTEPMETEFDITPIVNYWTSCNNDMAYDNNPAYEYGFIMMLTQEHENIEKLSVWQSEYSGTSVYIAIDYNNLSGSYYINSCDTGKFLTRNADADIVQGIYGGVDSQGWSFVYKGSNLYEITLPSDSNTVLYMDSSHNVATGTRSSLNSANYTWQLSFYYNYVTIRNQGAGKYLYAPGGGITLSGTSSVSLAHWRMCKTSKYANLNYFRLSGSEWVDVNENLQLSIGTKSPASPTWCSSSDFTFTSSRTSYVTVSSTGAITGIKKGYSKITVTHEPTGKTSSIIVIVGQSIESGKYYIKNKASNKYLNSSSVDANGYITQKTFDGSEGEKWLIEYISDGFYTIKSIYSQMYLSVSNGSAENGARITQISKSNALTSGVPNDYVKWRIRESTSGAFIIVPKTSPAIIMSLSCISANAVSGTNCYQYEYADDTNYRDEWYFAEVGTAFSVGGEFFCGDDIVAAHDDFVFMGYDSQYNIDPSVDILSEENLNSDIVYFSSHGDQHYIKLYNNVYLTDDAGPMGSNAVSITEFTLDNAKLYVYNACLTAYDYPGQTNLCEATIAAGVDCVIGWKCEIGESDGKLWQEEFFTALKNGHTVASARNIANSKNIYFERETIIQNELYGDGDIIVNIDAALEVEYD